MRIQGILLLPLAVGLALAQPAVTTPTVTVAPGSLASIFGTNLSATVQTASSVPLSVTLADVTSVTIAGAASPVAFVSAGRIGFQVSWAVTPGSVNLVVTNNAGTSQPVQIQVAQYAPAILPLNLGLT